MGLRGRLWVDDLRKPPSPTWWWVPTVDRAIDYLACFEIFEMSLGAGDTSRSIVLWLCEHPDRWPPVVRVHTADPMARDWLTGMIYHYNPYYRRG